MHETIYQRPADYDLEHEGDARDVHFYRRLVQRLQPARVLELACGSGRITLPLAAALSQPGAGIVGIELNDEMLAQARMKLAELEPAVARRVRLEPGDMRTWRSTDRFDLVLLACSSITHLLTLEDQLAVWRLAHAHLDDGGRFVLDITLPDLGSLAESLRLPPRAVTEVDLDQTDAASGNRLIRQRTTRFDIVTQRADIQFLYDKFENGVHASRYVSDFTSHVFFPRELQLLYLHTGFRVEAIWGDYAFRPAVPGTREIVMVGLRA